MHGECKIKLIGFAFFIVLHQWFPTVRSRVYRLRVYFTLCMSKLPFQRCMNCVLVTFCGLSSVCSAIRSLDEDGCGNRTAKNREIKRGGKEPHCKGL